MNTVHEHPYRGYIPELNIIRAVGIVLVVLNHTWPLEWQRTTTGLQLAWAAMDAFFVLSGFLITGILLDSRSKPDYYRSYYIRRALRILPLYYLVITLLTCVVILHHSGDHGPMQHWKSIGWYFAYLGNIPTAITGTWPNAVKNSYIPLWSLQIEEQFYIFFPFLIHRFKLATLVRILWGVVGLSLFLRLAIYFCYPGNQLVQYVFLPCRMDGLALGSLIAIRFRQSPWRIPKKRLTVMTIVWIAAALVPSIWVGFDHRAAWNRTIGFSLSSFASAHLVLWLICFRGSPLAAFCRTRIVQHFGKISYGVYLIHMPVAAVLKELGPRIGMDFGGGFTRVLGVLAVSIGCASLSWHFLERPLLAFGKSRDSHKRGRPIINDPVISVQEPSQQLTEEAMT